MKIEYQIDVEYAGDKDSGGKTYRFESIEKRDWAFEEIFTNFFENKVDDAHLREFGGITVSSYTYNEANPIAPIVPYASFNEKSIEGILQFLDKSGVGSTLKYK